MSMSSPSSPAFSPDHISPSNHLCYVHCSFCDTVLAVSVPYSSLFKSVTVRCGHCTNLLGVNMRGLLLPSTNQLHHFPNSCLNPQDLLEEMQNGSSNMNMLMNHQLNPNDLIAMQSYGGLEHQELPKPPPVNRPPGKRQRVPSAYNRFIKEEIQRIKAANPDISHREAFSAAAKNWAHFPHIHFGLMPDHQPVKKPNFHQLEGDEVSMMEGYYGSAATSTVGLAPH